MTKDLTIDPYATHLPVLTAMMALTNYAGHDTVLELGCGNYSTPILHEMCRVQNRQLISVESDYEWLNKFINYREDWHRFVLANAAKTASRCDPDCGIDNTYFGLVFVDNHPVEQRKSDIEWVRNKADYLVIHDTEPAVEHIYGFAEILKTFKYRRDYTLLTPHTTIVSDTNPLDLDIFEQTK